MRAITVIRAAAWLGVVILGWSMNLRWGLGQDIAPGVPGQFSRHVMGAALLAGIAAMALSVSGRKGHPPARNAKIVAVAATALVLLLLFLVRRNALASFPGLLEGNGFRWMLAGAGMVLGAVVGVFGVRPPETKSTKGKTSSKPRAGGRPKKKRARK